MIPAPDEWLAYLGWREAFREVIDPVFYSLEWLDDQVLSGKAVFVASADSATVYEIREYPTGARAIHALLAAGGIDDIRNSLVPALEDRGRRSGCVAFDISSREGWVKALKPLGFEAYQTSIRKPL